MQPDTSNLPGYWFCIKGDGEGACDEGGLIPEGKLTPLTQEDRAEALRREAEKVKELEAERLRAMAKQAAEAAILAEEAAARQEEKLAKRATEAQDEEERLRLQNQASDAAKARRDAAEAMATAKELAEVGLTDEERVDSKAIENGTEARAEAAATSAEETEREAAEILKAEANSNEAATSNEAELKAGATALQAANQPHLPSSLIDVSAVQPTSADEALGAGELVADSAARMARRKAEIEERTRKRVEERRTQREADEAAAAKAAEEALEEEMRQAKAAAEEAAVRRAEEAAERKAMEQQQRRFKAMQKARDDEREAEEARLAAGQEAREKEAAETAARRASEEQELQRAAEQRAAAREAGKMKAELEAEFEEAKAAARLDEPLYRFGGGDPKAGMALAASCRAPSSTPSEPPSEVPAIVLPANGPGCMLQAAMVMSKTSGVMSGSDEVPVLNVAGFLPGATVVVSFEVPGAEEEVSIIEVRRAGASGRGGTLLITPSLTFSHGAGKPVAQEPTAKRSSVIFLAATAKAKQLQRQARVWQMRRRLRNAEVRRAASDLFGGSPAKGEHESRNEENEEVVIVAAAADQMLATDNAVEATAGRAAFEEQQHAAAARTASKALSPEETMAKAMAKADAMLAAAEAKAKAKFADNRALPPVDGLAAASMTSAPQGVRCQQITSLDPTGEGRTTAGAKVPSSVYGGDPMTKHAAMAAAAAAQVAQADASTRQPAPAAKTYSSANAQHTRPGSAAGGRPCAAASKKPVVKEGDYADAFDADDNAAEMSSSAKTQAAAVRGSKAAKPTDSRHQAVGGAGAVIFSKRTEPAAADAALPASTPQPPFAVDVAEPLESAIAAALGAAPRVLQSADLQSATARELSGSSRHAPTSAETATVGFVAKPAAASKAKRARPDSAKPSKPAGGQPAAHSPSPPASRGALEADRAFGELMPEVDGGGRFENYDRRVGLDVLRPTAAGRHARRAQSAEPGARRVRQQQHLQSDGGASAIRQGSGRKEKGRGGGLSFEGGAVYTELCEFQDFTGRAREPEGGATARRRRRARSAHERQESLPAARSASPPPEALNKSAAAYLVGLRSFKEDPNPYLAEPSPLLGGKPQLYGMKPVKLGHGKVGGGKAEGGGMAAQLLHEQQLRILASLYGAPLRCVGVPPTSGPADLFGLGGVAKRMPAGGGVAAARAARDGVSPVGSGVVDEPEPEMQQFVL